MNQYLQKQRKAQLVFFEAGEQHGRQQIIDMLSLALRDPDIVGNDIFGRDRLVKLVAGIGRYMDEYRLAFAKHDETDYWRKRLDDELAKAYGEELHDSFLKRYEFAADYDYTTNKWR